MSATSAPSRAVRLFGTEQAVEAPRILRAGSLSAELEAGNLRYIRHGGAEMIRAISFVVRDRNWATYDPEITGLTIQETPGRFSVTYAARAGDASQRFAWCAEIIGTDDGTLRFLAVGTAETDFLTNRTGFVVLHPIEGVAGRPVTIEHIDGRVVEGRFPELIDPVQPMMELRALTHEFAPGASVRCLMQGDTFEMEDQRNWTDASYKTYVRPLALPWPYTLAAGTRLEQAVTLSVSGSVAPTAGADDAIGVTIGAAAGTMPPVGIGLDPSEHEAAAAAIGTLRAAGVAHVLCRHDPRAGHDSATLARAVGIARNMDAEPWLEAVIASVEGFEQEIAELGDIVRGLGSPFTTVLVSPAADLSCTLPGSVWPPCPPAGALYRAARAAFPGVRLGGGMFSYFTELNRKRPPPEAIDLVSFTTCPIVHAGDDRTVLENLESLPAIAASVRAFAGGVPFHVGPSAIAMRDNPYGEAPLENPGNVRQAMSRVDPRQRGLLAAAWTLGHVARLAEGGAAALTLGDAAGPSGLVHAPAAWPQPHFDAAGGVYPVFHVVRGLASLAGSVLLACRSERPHDLLGLAVAREGGVELWLANLTLEPLTARVAGLDGPVRITVLDEDGFVAATGNAGAFDAPGTALTSRDVVLAPLAVARLRRS